MCGAPAATLATQAAGGFPKGRTVPLEEACRADNPRVYLDLEINGEANPNPNPNPDPDPNPDPNPNPNSNPNPNQVPLRATARRAASSTTASR